MRRPRILRRTDPALIDAEARDWLSTMRPTTHPYGNDKPTWWGGPALDIEADLGFEDERNDR